MAQLGGHAAAEVEGKAVANEPLLLRMADVARLLRSARWLVPGNPRTGAEPAEERIRVTRAEPERRPSNGTQQFPTARTEAEVLGDRAAARVPLLHTFNFW